MIRKKSKTYSQTKSLRSNNLDDSLKQSFFSLLRDQKEFRSFFQYIDYETVVEDPVLIIKKHFASEICENANFETFIEKHPVALAYALAIINVRDRFSVTPPWILKNYPKVEGIMDHLRNRPCLLGCSYCEQALDARRGLKFFFGFDSYRTFGGEPLQENAVKAAIDNKSLLAIFPTGGGKSITFQVPALMSGENVKGLTVVISPLQSLMKDQVDNLEKSGITDAVTINGLLDPIERAKSFERVEDGSASILYISPESLRSRTIEHILLGRKITRFVIDEAHCFSAWGQDFRVDYLYIGDFIKAIQEKKNLAEGIPVSCFTATAKQKVIEDIQAYFKDKLSIELEVFSSNAARTNLKYKVIEKANPEEKYNTLRNLIQQKECPTIIYVSRTRRAYELAERLTMDGYPAKPYHDNYREALQFVEDYFRLNYTSFLQKYFKGSRKEEILKNISPRKFKQLFGALSPAQLSIIKDNQNKYISVLAGPGSGKTRVLVHKLASLILMEDVKHEQLLMLTFTRAAATEFKKRLIKLVGGAANYIEIKTFHSYCFNLLGRVGNVEKFEDVIKNTIKKIRSGEVEPGRIAKTVLVIDEAQDMDREVFALIQTLMAQNEDMRVIAVGDDDQNIFEFRGSSAVYLKKFIMENQGANYELLENYRSKSNIVGFSNQFAAMIRNRLKKNEIVAHSQENGEIRIIRYSNNNLLVPVVEDLSSAELIGSTCVLTHTNDEALQVTGLLLQKGISARLIQSNDGFYLYDLVELRFFLKQLSADPTTSVVCDDIWNIGKRILVNRYGKSEMLDICKRVILDFEAIYKQRRYISDFEVFIKESRLEDFYTVSRETIFVSTIHKAKGREFDNVFLLLENFDIDTDEKKRQLYVAMTRAKSNLTIHLNGCYLNHIQVENSTRLDDIKRYELPTKLAMQLGYRDVFLDYFIARQNVVDTLRSGDILRYKDGEWITDKGKSVFRISKRCAEQLERVREKGYEPQFAKVNFIVFWRKEAGKKEIKIVLPELHFERVETR